MNRFCEPFRTPSADYSRDLWILGSAKSCWKYDMPTLRDMQKPTERPYQPICFAIDSVTWRLCMIHEGPRALTILCRPGHASRRSISIRAVLLFYIRYVCAYICNTSMLLMYACKSFPISMISYVCVYCE